MNYFSKNLKWLREAQGMGQAELAKQLGVTRDNVASYERRSVPKLDVLMKLVKLFHVTVEQMVERDLAAGPGMPSGVVEPPAEYAKQDTDTSLTMESLQKLVSVQEKYIKTLEEKIESGSKK